MKHFFFTILLTASLYLPSWTQADTVEHKLCACHAKQTMNKLNLSEEQKSKMKTIRAKYRTEMKAQRQKIRELNHQATSLIHQDKTDESALNKIAEQKSQALYTLMKNRMNMQHEMYRALDAKQKELFRQMSAEKKILKKECACH